MLRSTKVLAGAISVILVAPILLLLPARSVADNGVEDEMMRCASVDDASARLACYDGLADRKVSSHAIVAAPTPAPGKPPVASPPDELGSESLGRKDDMKDEEAAVVARVIRCDKDARKDYRFYLEGGQVWKQISDRKLYYKNCDFNVTISKDFFGYKMQVDGEKGKIRISRIR